MQFHLHSVVKHSLAASLLHHTICGLWAQESLAIRSLSRHEMAPSPSAGCLLYCHEKTPSLSGECSLYRHEKNPLPSAVLSLSPWGDSIAISLQAYRGKTLLPSAVLSLCLCEETPCGETACAPLNAVLYSVVSLLHCSTLSQLIFWKRLVHYNVLPLSSSLSL